MAPSASTSSCSTTAAHPSSPPKVERQTLQCIRCAACLNTCPVYRQTGGHAYGSVYAGPIGAILTPQLMQMKHAQSLPYASSLCGRATKSAPSRSTFPKCLIELRAQVVDQQRRQPLRWFDPMYPRHESCQPRLRQCSAVSVSLQRLGRIALRFFTGKDGWIHHLPSLGARWTVTRDLRGTARPDLPRLVGLARKGEADAGHPSTRVRPSSLAFVPRRQALPTAIRRLCRSAAQLYFIAASYSTPAGRLI